MMSSTPPSIAILTSGGAGMYCGSCMRDNTLAKAMIKLGWDVQLIPTYTPIRTDEDNVSIDQVFFGGLNVYLQQKIPLFRFLPRFMDRWLDSPKLINRVAADRAPTDAAVLGKLTVSMLKGMHGAQRKEVRRLVDYLKNELKPDLVMFSNLLIGGCIEKIKSELNVPVVVTLQGDDLFLKDLRKPYQAQAIKIISKFDKHVDQYITYSNYYADFMADYLQLSRNKFSITPLGIDVEGFQLNQNKQPRGLTIGYLARHCPEKGLHHLVDAFIQLRKQNDLPELRLHTAGWLGARDQDFFKQQQLKLEEAGLTADFEYHGVVDRTGKQEFLSNIDLLSVPTAYQEPKGIFVLEALAAGVPVVQPDHGAFPELLNSTGGGQLFTASDNAHLAQSILELLKDEGKRLELGQAGRLAVIEKHSAANMAESTMEIFQRLL